jgi:hypothetical protein
VNARIGANYAHPHPHLLIDLRVGHSIREHLCRSALRCRSAPHDRLGSLLISASKFGQHVCRTRNAANRALHIHLALAERADIPASYLAGGAGAGDAKTIPDRHALSVAAPLKVHAAPDGSYYDSALVVQ